MIEEARLPRTCTVSIRQPEEGVERYVAHLLEADIQVEASNRHVVAEDLCRLLREQLRVSHEEGVLVHRCNLAAPEWWWHRTEVERNLVQLCYDQERGCARVWWWIRIR